MKKNHKSEGKTPKSKRKTVTFQPAADVLELLARAEAEGRGVPSDIINQALRDKGEEVLRRWLKFREPSKDEGTR